jgi:glycosyltransferase involved in cell wall biosynthesis
MNTGNDDRFAVFILTHGRPNNVKTYDTLRKQGYTGEVYIIVDNEDSTIDEYRARFGDRVIVFDKEAIARAFDEGDNFKDRRAVFYARNASFEIARNLGLDYFLQLDDDYVQFRYKVTPSGMYWSQAPRILNLGDLFARVLEFYKSIPADCVALSQGGDFIGGENSQMYKVLLKRKVMNSFFCSTARPFEFCGRVNEDVNTYVALGNRGRLFLTLGNACLEQERTQKSGGGMSELYLSQGTYIKSFYTLLFTPSCVSIRTMGVTDRRLHHHINWNAAVPCIVSERHCKRLAPRLAEPVAVAAE